jgi:hypothetical protein
MSFYESANVQSRGELGRTAKNEIASHQGWRCGVCAELLPAAFECDHLIPFCLTRSHARAWLWCLCNNCHGRKSLLERRETASVKRKLQSLAQMTTSCAYCHACRAIVSKYFLHRCSETPANLQAAWRARLLCPANEEEADLLLLESETRQDIGAAESVLFVETFASLEREAADKLEQF